MGKSGQKPRVMDYYAAQHVALCHGPIDSINGILIGDKYIYPMPDPYAVIATVPVVQPDGEVWNVAIDWQTTAKITDNTDFPCILPKLFGGDKGEGGCVGRIGIFLGGPTQTIPDFYAARLGLSEATAPGFRRVASAFFAHIWALWPGFQWATNAPILRETQWTVTRLSRPGSMDLTHAEIPAVPMPRTRTVEMIDPLDTNNTFTQEVHDLYIAGPDANPSHMIFECLVDDDFGLGMDVNLIDVASFNTAAEILFAENLGLSFKWTTQTTVQEVINDIERHIDGKLFMHPATGKMTLRLVREVTDLSGALHLNEFNSKITSYQRKSWNETVNELIVSWTDPFSESANTVVVQNIANLSRQGYPVADSKNFYMARNSKLATFLGNRELRSQAAPLSTIEMEATREAWDVVPTDVVLVTSEENGIEAKAYRVVKVNYGKPGSSAIKLSLIEDVFSLAIGEIRATAEKRASPTTLAPAAAAFQRMLTMPAYALMRAGKFDGLTAETAIMGCLASSPLAGYIGGYLNEEVADPLGVLSWVQKASVPILGRSKTPALAAEATSKVASIGTYQGGFPGDPSRTYAPPYEGWFGFVGDGSEGEQEIVYIRKIDLDVYGQPSIFWLIRGALDTVPRAWPANTPITWMSADYDVSSPTLEAIGATIDYKLQTRTPVGVLPIASAPTMHGLVSARPHLPNRPAAVTLNGLGLPQQWVYGVVGSEVRPVNPGAPIPAISVGLDGVPEITLAEDDTLEVEWANRNRLTEDNIVVAWSDSDTAVEAGQTARVRIEKMDGTVIHEYAGIVGTSQLVPAVVVNTISHARLKVFADSAAGESIQHAEFRIFGPVVVPTFDDTGTTFDTDTSTMDADA